MATDSIKLPDDESEVAAVSSGKVLFFLGPRNKAWISEWGDNIRNSPQVGPVAIRSGKTYFLGK